MKPGRKPILRALAILLGLLLINISVNSTFIGADKIDASGKPANNIESLFELIAEIGLGCEECMKESAHDDSPLNEEIKVIDYIVPQTDYNSSAHTVSLNQYSSHRCIKYSVLFEIAPPPPKRIC